jgi:cell division protein ZapA
MSEVTLQVGGRPYTVSCADGEETHVQHLAGIVDAKLAALGGNRAPGDAKNLLFAALILADEVDEMRRRNTSATSAPNEAATARTLTALAERLEHLAQMVENAGG